MKNKGFTLIELLIVVVIIAIIALIAIPNLSHHHGCGNETAGAASCKAFAEAEEIYHRTDHNGDGVLEYATALKGNDSLLETVAGAGDLALIDKSFANAEGDVTTGAVPKAGYVFTVLTAQGSAATGGSLSYVTGTPAHMTLGYALSAIPYSYNGTGRDTFIINKDGTIFQKDRTSTLTTHETIFNPDTSTTGGWIPAD